MTTINYQEEDWFKNVDAVITEPLKFKAKLNIGEAAYKSLRLKNNISSLIDYISAAGTGAGIASSAAVASTFFAPNAFLGALGLATAATPIGWVIAAGVASSGAWFGLTKLVNKHSSEQITVIPKFINTPIDILALAIFDLLAPLAFKVAEIDGQIAQSEEDIITSYFVNEWGYDAAFTNQACLYSKSKLDDLSIKELAISLAKFKKDNPDCHYESMTKEVLKFLNEIIEADNIIDEREEMAIERVQRVFNDVSKGSVKSQLVSNIKKIKTSFEMFKLKSPG